ncbi:MAG: hypothetical protein BGP00_02070 [Novosphingobium sp. 63-713]|nr:MAG: hypothetical protein BGP00_02070 [Novosphingobium sp. 63-713]
MPHVTSAENAFGIRQRLAASLFSNFDIHTNARKWWALSIAGPDGQADQIIEQGAKNRLRQITTCKEHSRNHGCSVG